MKNQFESSYTTSNYFYSFLYMEALPTPGDYKSPLKSSLVNQYKMLNLQTTKRAVQTFKKVEIKDDQGWMFNNIQKNDTFSSDTIIPDFTLKNEFTEDVLFTYFMYFGRKVDTFDRRYMKIQQVLAAIGGFAKLFHTFIAFIIHSLGGTFKAVKLMNLTEFSSDDENGKSDEKNKILSNLNMSGMQLHNSSMIEIRINSTPPNKKAHPKMETSYFSYICFKCSRKKNTPLMRKFINIKWYFDCAFDVTTYLELIHQFYLFKKIMLKENQIEILNLIKPRVFDLRNKKKNISYSNRIKELSKVCDFRLNIDERSKKMLDLLDKENKNLFFDKNSNLYLN